MWLASVGFPMPRISFKQTEAGDNEPLMVLKDDGMCAAKGARQGGYVQAAVAPCLETCQKQQLVGQPALLHCNVPCPILQVRNAGIRRNSTGLTALNQQTVCAHTRAAICLIGLLATANFAAFPGFAARHIHAPHHV